MYLVSWLEEEAKVEASLGGRVTKEEVWVFSEELKDIAASMFEPYLVLLDISRAQHFDSGALDLLSSLKDYCLESGAAKVVTIARNESEKHDMTANRLQMVLEGREEYVLDTDHFHWAPAQSSAERKAA